MNRVSSIFSQLLQWFPRGEFEALVRKHGAERRSKGFSCWGQLVAMLFCQLGQAKSLREIHEGLRASEGRLRHLGLSGAPPRSTLAYANQHRTHRLFEELFQVTFRRCQAPLQAAGIFGKAVALGHRLFSLDATVIDLCAAVFDWAKFRTTRGAVKLHLLLDHDSYLPAYAVITPGKQHEIRVARRLKLPPGSMLIFDRGYTDYDWFATLSRQKVFFVTRLKEQADFVVERRAVSESEQQAGVRRDEILVFRQQATADNDRFFRRVVYRDAEKEREFVFVTNHFELAPSQVAAVYRQRWQVGVSSQGHIVQSVKDRPRPKDSGLVAGEAPWRESKTAEPSDNMLGKECAQRTRSQRAVNADVASLHESPVAETVHNARKQQGLAETSPIRQLSPAGYQRRHGVKEDVETGEALDARRRNLAEEMLAITVSGKCRHRRQGGGSGCSTVDGRAAKRARREEPGPVSTPSVKVRQG